MEYLVLFCVYCMAVFHYATKITAILFVPPEAYISVNELITSQGYPVEDHTLVTSDGYILSMQHIPHGRNNYAHAGGDKDVVLLVHGELGDSKTWFLNPPGQGLGYILPDEGFDVWMINQRGCAYSRTHVKYPTNSYEYWDYSFDDIAVKDIPAAIDYVLNATGKEDLHLIGYSRGNTVGFMMLSELEEYNKKVKLLVALAPVAWIGHFNTFIKYLIPFSEEIAAALLATTRGEFVPTLDNEVTRIIIAEYCEVDNLEMCENLLFAIAGQDRRELNESRVPIYTAQYPSTTSVKCLYHYTQLYRSNTIRKYDYGPALNLQYYNQLTPPDFEVSRITAPVALFTSENDKIADPTDVNFLRSQLKSVVLDYRDPKQEYNHFDFIWAKDVQDRIYKPLVEFMKNM